MYTYWQPGRFTKGPTACSVLVRYWHDKCGSWGSGNFGPSLRLSRYLTVRRCTHTNFEHNQDGCVRIAEYCTFRRIWLGTLRCSCAVLCCLWAGGPAAHRGNVEVPSHLLEAVARCRPSECHFIGSYMRDARQACGLHYSHGAPCLCISHLVSPPHPPGKKPSRPF